MDIDKNHFEILDYIVVIATLLFSLLIGVYYAMKKQSNEDLLVGGRNMSPLPIAASMLVTYLSAITILGYPAEIYANGLQIFMMTVASSCTVPISIYFFVSFFYEMKLTSVYKYLELRFNSYAVRMLASSIFILQVTLISGIILYAPAIALKSILGLPVWISLVLIGISGTIYTSIGGIKAVVWTDVFQFVMIAFGMLAIVIKGISSAGGIMNAFKIAGKNGRLQVFDFTVDPFMRHNVLNFIVGYGFTVIVLAGTHQPQVQRFSSLPSARHAYKAMALSVPLNIFIMVLVIFTGISIFATYGQCDPILLGHIRRPDEIVPYFVVKNLSNIPGLLGLFVACIFSAVLSTISSALNSLSAVTWEDFLKRLPYFKNLSDFGQSNTTRITSFIYGILIILLGFVAQNLGQILQATVTAVGATGGTLGAIFIMGLFMPCINKFGAIIGMVVGLVSMLYLTYASTMLSKTKPFSRMLPTSLESCSHNVTTIQSFIDASPGLPEFEYEWYEKIATISYVLYSFVGAVITIVFGLLGSLITGGCGKKNKVNPIYLHPLIRQANCCSTIDKSIEISPANKNVDRISNTKTSKVRPSGPYPQYEYKQAKNDNKV